MTEPLDVGSNPAAFTSDEEEQQDWSSSLDQEDLEPPHIKEEQEDQEDLEPPHIKEEQEDQEDLEPPHIKEEQEDQEDPEPPHIKEEEADINFPFAPVSSDEDCGEPEPAMWESSDEDDGGASEPEGFDSSDEEYYQNNMDPFEDGEESPPPATRSPPVKKSRRAQLHPQPPPLSWKTDKDPDTAPPVSEFQPARTPGPLLDSSTRTPLDLFKLFFSEETVRTLCQNTNRQVAEEMANGKKFKWAALDVECFYKYIGLLLYMAMVKMNSFANYWRQNRLLSLPFPSQIMTRERYSRISANLHLSDPDEDVHNDGRKGTAEHDELFQLKPLMDTIKSACKAFYHPHRDLAVDERMVVSKAKTGTSRYLKEKLIKLGFKLFALADSRNGYTVDFSVHTGKSHIPSKHGLSYDVVMSLVQPGYLGTGYHIYMDKFFTSLKLFMALHECRFAACGAYREYRKEFPHTDVNALTKKSASGSMRWIRDGPIVFVKWMDTREVSVCSTIHTAYSGETVQRRMKQQDGSRTWAPVPYPTPVAEFSEHMGGVALSDQLIQYYSTQHKTRCWSRNLFYHFVDIATTNSFILHKELCLAQQTEPMTHKAFMEQLTADLCGKSLRTAPAKPLADHLPVIVADAAGPGKKVTPGCRKCELCRSQGWRKDTTWMCRECDVVLCLEPDRNCFAAWHDG